MQFLASAGKLSVHIPLDASTSRLALLIGMHAPLHLLYLHLTSHLSKWLSAFCMTAPMVVMGAQASKIAQKHRRKNSNQLTHTVTGS